MNVEIAVPLKHLSDFWRTLQVLLINCEISLILTWSANCVIYEAGRVTTSPITDTKLYVPVVTLSANDNAKLLQQLKSGFKHIIIWCKYQSGVTTQAQNQYFDYLTDATFQGVNMNRLVILPFENAADRTLHTGYNTPKAKVEEYNVMIVGRNVFDPAVKMIKGHMLTF